MHQTNVRCVRQERARSGDRAGFAGDAWYNRRVMFPGVVGRDRYPGRAKAAGRNEEKQTMAYRFVLEVPEPLAFEVNTAVYSTPDVQVHHVRNSHGLGFDDPFVNLTVAAHSFEVIERIYQWMVDYGQPYPDLRLVMHDGRRVSLPKANVSLIVAAIRRDQPWIDHTMPMIGSHEPKPWLSPAARRSEEPVVPVLVLDDPESLAERFRTAPRVPVHNLAPAEDFYRDVLDLQVVARAHRRDDGSLRAISGHYDPTMARLNVEEADVVFLENGPLQINLERSRRGQLLPYGVDFEEIHTTATREQMASIKGRILMGGYNLLESTDDVLRFADPFNVVWVITPAVALSSGEPAALEG